MAVPSSGDLFSNTYSDARARFIDACARRSIPVRHFEHPLKAEDGTPLYCDVADIGPSNASAVCIQIAGTHGVEGFLGSAVLIELIEQGPPQDIRLVLVHALNPWGFANLCRFTENRVDLNRNFVDFTKPLPENPGYRHLHSAICPDQWTEATRTQLRTALSQYDATHGAGAGLDATLRGQYSHPDGFNFGGADPQWSNRCLQSICEQFAGNADDVLVVDWHTGLGRRAENVIIPYTADGDAGGEALARFGLGWIKPATGFPAYTGLVTEGVRRFLPRTRVTGLLAEFGIDDDPWVNVDGLRYDRWLCSAPSGSMDIAEERRWLRDLYCPTDADWRKSAIADATRFNRYILEANG